MNNPLFDAYVTRTREGAGMIVVHDHDAVKRTPRAFKAGHAVAFVADQGVLGLASTFVPFFGRPPRRRAVGGVRAALPAPRSSWPRFAGGWEVPVRSRGGDADTGDRDSDVDGVVLATAILGH
jgi:KDO2-lipid IV(A) lauroyltransferase